MIEIKNKRSEETEDGVINQIYDLFIDGEKVRDAEVEEVKRNGDESSLTINLRSEDIEKIFLEKTFLDFLELNIKAIVFNHISLYNFENLLPKTRDSSPPNFSIYLEKLISVNFHVFLLAPEYDVRNWNKDYTFVEFHAEFIRQIKLSQRNDNEENSDLCFYDKPVSEIAAFHFFEFNIENPSEKIGNVVNQISLKLDNAQAKALEILEKRFSKENTRLEFNFPPSVRVACEQYLQYFTDFLSDIGVSAITNIEHNKAGKTLFSVNVENKKVALDAIREALEIYLELPMSPLVNEIEISDTRMLSLRAEINTLKSRLDYAQIRQIETEKRADLQRELIDAQKEILREKDSNIQALQKSEPRKFEPSIVYESVVETNYIDAEIVEETNTGKLTQTSNKELDLGLVTVKPAKLALGVEANTPRLTRLGIKKGKELFDYLDKKFNSEEEK